MIISDPSEAIELENILPEVRKRFSVIEEKAIGGNIIIFLLKDIAHHFIENNSDASQLLEKIFIYEDIFLENHPPDFLFGIYQKSKT